MFDLDRRLVNVNFEGYRLANALDISVASYPLPCRTFNATVDTNTTQFQVLADMLLRNRLTNGLEAVLEDGQIIQLNDTGFECLGELPQGSNDPSVSWPYASNGAIIRGPNGREIPTSSLRFPPSEFPFHLSHHHNDMILGYQTIPASKCSSFINVAENKKASSLFWVSCLTTEGNVLGEYLSWGRPLVVHFFDNAILLGSPTGFTHASVEPEVEIETTTNVPDLTEMLESRRDEEIEEESEEHQINSMILRSFDIENPTNLIGSSPLLSFIGQKTDESGACCLGIQCGVDMAVFQLLNRSLDSRHIYTINAFAFVQSGKTKKKFIAFSKDLAVLAETRKTIYIYRMDAGIGAPVAKQYLVDLEDKEILGLRLLEGNKIFVLLEDSFSMVHIN